MKKSRPNETNNEPKICSFCRKIIPAGREKSAVMGDNNCYICKDCIILSYNYITAKPTGLPDDLAILTPKSIKEHMDRFVIGQEGAKKALAVAIYNHYKRISNISETPIEKSNVLLVGPTGTGKTYLVQTVANILGVPLLIVDATSYTQAGYVGDNVEDIIGRLVVRAGGDIAKAQKGIIYIDEIDKLARRKDSVSAAKDVNGEGVQYALLKLLEGKDIEVNGMNVDTRNILFIAGGAFAGIEKIVNLRDNSARSLGFSASIPERRERSEADILADLTPSDLIAYGMTPELMGRLPRIVTLAHLGEDDLVRIISEPENSLLKQYQELFAADNVKLTFTDDALRAVAEKAISNGSGARGLRSIMETLLQDLMFSIPDEEDVTECLISEEFVKGTEPPLLIREDRPALAAHARA